MKKTIALILALSVVLCAFAVFSAAAFAAEAPDAYAEDDAVLYANDVYAAPDGDYGVYAYGEEDAADITADNEKAGKKFKPLTEVIILAVSAVAALIVVSSMKSSMKTNEVKTEAKNYVRSGSFMLSASRDIEIDKQVTKTAIPKQNQNGK